MELKAYEIQGLSYLLLQVLALRPLVRMHFTKMLWECNKELQQLVSVSGGRSGDQTRVLNSVNMFLTMCKFMESYAPLLPLPFRYEDFRTICVEKIKWQIGLIARTDKLATFFQSIDFLIDKGSILPGRDYRIEQPKVVHLKGGSEVVLKPAETRVIYMNLTNIHRYYAAMGGNGDKPATLTTLTVNLNSCPAFIGNVSGFRFKWLEEKSMSVGETYKDPATGGEGKGMAVVRMMEEREKMTSAIVLNYDLLTKMFEVDFERKKESVEIVEIESKLPF